MRLENPWVSKCSRCPRSFEGLVLPRIQSAQNDPRQFPFAFECVSSQPFGVSHPAQFGGREEFGGESGGTSISGTGRICLSCASFLRDQNLGSSFCLHQMSQTEDNYGPIEHRLDVLNEFDECFFAFSRVAFSDEIEALWISIRWKLSHLVTTQISQIHFAGVHAFVHGA